MSNVYFEQESMEDILNTLDELRKEIENIKQDLTILQKTLGRSAWNTSVNSFGFNKDL